MEVSDGGSPAAGGSRGIGPQRRVGAGPGSWGRLAKGAEAGRRPRASRDRSRAGGGGIPRTFTWWPGSRLRWCVPFLPSRPHPHALPAVARCAPPSPSPPTHPHPPAPASTGWLKACCVSLDLPPRDRNRPRRCWVSSPPWPSMGLGRRGRSSPGEVLSVPREEEERAPVRSSGTRGWRASAVVRAGERSVEGRVATVARWSGPGPREVARARPGGRVGVPGCHGTALVLGGPGRWDPRVRPGGRPWALERRLWRVPCASALAARGPLPGHLSGFRRRVPRRLSRRLVASSPSVLPPTRCRAPVRWRPSGPWRPPIRVLRRRRPGGGVVCRRGAVLFPPPTSLPTPRAGPPFRRACPGVGRVPGVRRGGRGRALPSPVRGCRAPARLSSLRGERALARRPRRDRPGAPVPRPRAAVGGGRAGGGRARERGCWRSVPGVSAPPPPVCPRPRGRCRPVSLARPLRVGRAAVEGRASSPPPASPCGPLRSGRGGRGRRRRRRVRARPPSCSARPAHWETRPRAPPGARGSSPAHRAPTWLILPVAYACLKD